MAGKKVAAFPNKPIPLGLVRPNVTVRTQALAQNESEKLRKQAILMEFMVFLAEEKEKHEPKTEVSPSARIEDHEDEDEGDFCYPGDVIEGRFHVVSKLCQGGFGQIFKAIDSTLKFEVALKFEEVEENHPNMEAHVLARYQGARHCPTMYARATFPDCSFIAMQLLGKNLSGLKKQCSLHPSRLSISTSVRVIQQCIEAIESLHNIGYLHRDIKPANFCIGNDKQTQNTIFLIDFGLARYYLTKEGNVRPQRDNIGFRGTLKYASLTAHMTKDYARRDDMWSLFYSIYELMLSDLPWKASNDKDVVGKMKLDHKPESMCQHLLPEIADYVRLVRNLEYADKPDYARMINCFSRIGQRMNVKPNDSFDWQVSYCASFTHLPAVK